MQVKLPPELETALEAEEAGSLNEIVRARRPEYFEILRQVAADPSAVEHYRSKAIYALGRWGDAAAVADITRGLATLKEQGRIAAMDALGRLGTPEAQWVIAEHTGDPSPQVRKFVVQALARISGPNARSALRAMAEGDPEGWIRTLAAQQVK